MVIVSVPLVQVGNVQAEALKLLALLITMAWTPVAAGRCQARRQLARVERCGLRCRKGQRLNTGDRRRSGEIDIAGAKPDRICPACACVVGNFTGSYIACVEDVNITIVTAIDRVRASSASDRIGTRAAGNRIGTGTAGDGVNTSSTHNRH